MGVPAFFRWLTRKYPSVVVHCIEEKSIDVNGVRVPIDSLGPNPNGVEFDNLYLDMNGIIHPCTHPEDKPAPRNEDEMMVAIFECIDRIFNIVRPRRLLYMAIDGVAPRAKMNQQRSRRFRASKESAEKDNEIKRIRAELLLKGIELPPEKPKEDHFDSNCITPGTPFMAKLSDCLHYYIHERLNNDPGWQNIKVILSDANVPGEGEHKIMDFIRKQRAQPDHDPNTQHCLCGADADLIMLGLATHEPNFTIIREEFKPNKKSPCDICGQYGHSMNDCIGGKADNDIMTFSSETDYIFVRLNVLREYLERELVMPNLPFKYEFDRVLDDWVFMCFFVGNDFLPHLPSLEIRENAIDRLIGFYKDCVYKSGGYITNSGDVNLERVQMIMNDLGKVEDEIFKRRQQNELQYKAREKAKKRRNDEYNEYNEYRPNWNLVKDTQFSPRSIADAKPVTNARQEAFNIRKAGMHSTTQSSEALCSTSKSGEKRKFDTIDEESDEEINDEVRLWEDGFKDRYYESKFDSSIDDIAFRNKVALHYVRGLCWVLKYYYQGCVSWKWYYPYYYAPFASDFINIADHTITFETNTQPFKPLEQLMSVFPAGSRKHVPKPWATLMTDPESPIIDFYPDDFKIDLNGKKFCWQGVALLPFVDETRLLKAVKSYYELLTPEEKRRNIRGDDRLYIGCKNSGYNFLKELYIKEIPNEQENAILIEGIKGTVLIADECIDDGGHLPSPVIGLDTIIGNVVVTVRYRDPKYPQDYKFPAIKLKGAIDPPRVLKPQDLSEEDNRNWRPMIGMVQSNTRGYLELPGHRMISHNIRQTETYNSVRPPTYRNNRNNYNNYNSNSNNAYNNNYNSNYNNNNNDKYRNYYYPINRNRGGYQKQVHPGYSTQSTNYSGGSSSDSSASGSGGYQRQYQYNYRDYRRNQYSNNERNNNERDPRDKPSGPYRDGYRQFDKSY